MRSMGGQRAPGRLDWAIVARGIFHDDNTAVASTREVATCVTNG